MAIRQIITLPHPTLRRKARKVTDFGAELQTLLDDMVDTMREAPGVGLAAPQVNMPLRVIVIEYSGEEDSEAPPKLYLVINPEIKRISKDVITGTEGCLSIPNVLGDVVRAEAVTVTGFNRQGKPIKIKADGWLARIFQHEIDHLDGILFVDRAEKVWISDEQTTQIAAAD
jgi:peptide deformylase